MVWRRAGTDGGLSQRHRGTEPSHRRKREDAKARRGSRSRRNRIRAIAVVWRRAGGVGDSPRRHRGTEPSHRRKREDTKTRRRARRSWCRGPPARSSAIDWIEMPTAGARVSRERERERLHTQPDSGRQVCFAIDTKNPAGRTGPRRGRRSGGEGGTAPVQVRRSSPSSMNPVRAGGEGGEKTAGPGVVAQPARQAAISSWKALTIPCGSGTSPMSEATPIRTCPA